MKSNFHFGNFLSGDDTFIPVKKKCRIKRILILDFDYFIQVLKLNYLDEQA